MKKLLYTLSLLSFLSALLVINIIPVDEIYSWVWLSIILIIISLLLRVFSNNQRILWIDFLALTTSLILITIGTYLLSPTTEFLITYGEKFSKIYAGILSLFPLFQLLIAFRENYALPKKIHSRIFVLAIIVSIVTLGGIELYGKTIDLYKLSDAEKSYLYSYNKYTPELIDLAVYEIKNGSSVSKKIALNFIGKNDAVVKENLDYLEEIIFNDGSNSNISEPIEYQGSELENSELENRLKLMIKINPEKALVVMRTLITDNNINNNLTIINALRVVVITRPELLNESCKVAKEIVRIENIRSEAKNLNYPDTDLMRLEKYLRDLPEKCGGLGL